MPNPQLTIDQRAIANKLLKTIRSSLDKVSGGDRELRFAYNRKMAKELIYDERSKPGTRRKLKVKKRLEQNGRCATCPNILPERGAILDRFRAVDGYTSENTQLICQTCDTTIQTKRRYT